MGALDIERASLEFQKQMQAMQEKVHKHQKLTQDDILNGRRVLSGATVGAAVLSVMAAVAVALGLWPRLSEYR